MTKGGDYDEIDESAADRIISLIDTEGLDYHEIRRNLVKRFTGWGAHRRDKMAIKIVERVADIQQFEEGRVTRSYTKFAIERATGPGGTTKARYKVVRTVDGKYLGRPENIRITTRKGTKVYGKNMRTGQKGRLK